MYCKKCKKKGKIFDRFCKDCGTKLERKKVDTKKIRKIIITSTIILIIALILLIGYKIVNYLRSPQYIAETYFKTVINNDIDKIYEYIDVNDNEFVSKTILKNKIDSLENVNYYEVEAIKQYQNYIYVNFNYSTNNDTNSSYVKLVKTNNILKPYKVISGMVVENITFKVPNGANITVDEIVLKNPIVKDGFDIYNINSMIKGKYNIKIEINDIKIDEEIEVKNNGVYTISNINIDEKLETLLVTKTREELNYIYNSIISGKTFDEIKGRYQVKTNKLKSSYNSIKRSINSKITSIEYVDLELKTATYSNNGKLLITYLADQKVTIGEEVIQKTGYITVEYDYINSAYEIFDINR